MSNYWSDVFSLRSYREFHRYRACGSGFRTRQVHPINEIGRDGLFLPDHRLFSLRPADRIQTEDWPRAYRKESVPLLV